MSSLMRRVACGVVVAGATLGLAAAPAGAQQARDRRGDAAAERVKKDREAAEAAAKRIAEAVDTGAALILGMQEGETKGEWPYEGVYREKGKIPAGYRVGGTAIASLALLAAPEPSGDAETAAAAMKERCEAIRRAAEFVAAAIDEPLMSFTEYNAGYDVRGWGYTYGLMFFLRLKEADAVPEGMGGADGPLEKAIAFYLEAIHKTEIPQAGGWNYSRPVGRDKVAPASPFMTGPTLQALFEAKRQGYAVDEAMVTRALDALERGRGASGTVAYGAPVTPGAAVRDGVPGAVGRMLMTETTLYLAGRSSVANIRGALDAFIVHWDWLNQRRAQPGTHVEPYGVAPYYFYYAHYCAAQAAELLPRAERAEYRRRINDLLFSVRQEDGSWNDRVFKRTANYGTSMAVLSLRMPQLPAPARWGGAAAAAPEPAGASTEATSAGR